ncbi:MAG: hypothetical protein WCH98_03510 [Verrucomicrobiota bacterium]
MAPIRVSSFLTSLALAATLHAATPSVPQAETPAEAPAKHTFFESLETFKENTITHPVAPFELVPGKDPNGWSFVIEPYVWAMGIEGKTGVGGYPAMNVNVDAVNVIRHLDWAVFAKGEIRKGRWGVLGDGYYAALSGSGDLGGNLYTDGSLQLQQAIASLALAYRIIDDRRGFLDIYAGARYNFLGIQMDLNTDSSGINALGTQISDAVASRISSAVMAQVDIVKPQIVSAVTAAAQAQLESAKAQATAAAESAVTAAQAQVAATKALAAATVTATVESDLSGKLLASESKTKPSIKSLKVLEKLAGDSRDRNRSNHRLEKVRLLEGDSRNTGQRLDEARRVEGKRDALHSIDHKELKGILASSKGAMREYIRAQAELEVARITGSVTSAVQARADAAKTKLATSISSSVKNALPTHESGDQWWIDPIVGLRGQINLTRWLFLAAQGDVGGFGVGSQITWNTQATVGVNFTRNIFAELGYRYMYVDYNKNNFLYQMNSFGLFSSIGVKF